VRCALCALCAACCLCCWLLLSHRPARRTATQPRSHARQIILLEKACAGLSKILFDFGKATALPTAVPGPKSDSVENALKIFNSERLVELFVVSNKATRSMPTADRVDTTSGSNGSKTHE
jgi:hypothetical protein